MQYVGWVERSETHRSSAKRWVSLMLNPFYDLLRRRNVGGTMTGYLPGDPRYGLSGEALANYYRTKAAQWAIYCWDKPGMAEAAARLAGGAEELRQEFRRARHRLRAFRVGRRPRHAGHVVLHAARRPRGGGQVRGRRADEQGRRLRARRHPPLVEQLRQARRRLSPARACSSSCAPDPRPARRSSSASTCTRTNPTSRRMAKASSSADRSARPTAPTTSAPRCCSNCPTARRRTRSGTTSRSPGTAGISAMRGSCGGCSGIEAQRDGGTHCSAVDLGDCKKGASRESISRPLLSIKDWR